MSDETKPATDILDEYGDMHVVCVEAARAGFTQVLVDPRHVAALIERAVELRAERDEARSAVALSAEFHQEREAKFEAEIERLAALVPVEIPPPAEPDGWGWYVPDHVRLVSPFPTREAAIQDAIREGHTNELHVGEMRALDLAKWMTAEDMRERVEEVVYDNLCIEDFRVHMGPEAEADRELDQWVRRYLEPDGSTYCEGAEVTAEEIALVRAAIGGAQ